VCSSVPTRFLLACIACGAVCFVLAAGWAGAQQTPLTAQVQIVKRDEAKLIPASAGAPDASGVAVWLVPVDEPASSPSGSVPTQHPQLVQRNKTFEPHVLVVQAGTTVQFPNKDPFFHNVFSLFDGKRFDLGLYEGGSTNSVKFERTGISFLFCNIHPEMSAVVIAVPTPYFAVSDRAGRLSIPNIPDARYALHVWYERSSPEDLKALDRTISVSADSHSLPPLQVIDDGNYKLAHKNKYGQDYLPSSNPAYNHP
jgi:plastocyanin